MITKIKGFNNASLSSKNITQHGKIPPVEDEDIEIFGTSPAISRTFQPIVRNIEFAQTQLLSDRETGRNCQYCSLSSSTTDYRGQHDTSYYQPQTPDDYNQRQQYHSHRRKQQAPCRTGHDREKVYKRGVNHSGIPSPEIKQLPIIPIGNVPTYTKKNPTVSSGASLKTETRKMLQLTTQPKLQTKDRE